MTGKLVVIGAGMASGRALEHILETRAGDWEITLFNAEPRGNYNRLMLSPVLSGERTYEEIVTHGDAWYRRNGITCRFGERVTAIDRERRIVVGERGEVPYDKLILGTGSDPFIPPLAGNDLDGVISYRDLEDTNRMIRAAASPEARAVVIGGGLLGLEAAAGMRMRGMEVTVVHIMGHLMERQLDESAAYLLQKALSERGIRILCSARSEEILGSDGRVRALRLDDGTELACDLLVMAAGIRPNTSLASAAGLEVNRGVVVDDHMVTSDPDILALGECVEHDGAVFGLVAPLYDQAHVVAATLADESRRFVRKDVAAKLKVTGCDLYSAGDFAAGEGREEIVFRDPGRGVYKRLVLSDSRIIGIVLYGDTADGPWFHRLMKDRADISGVRETVIFGPAHQAGMAGDPLAAIAALPPEAEICGCNGVCKGDVVSAIKSGAGTIPLIRTATKASASCGSCTGLVEKLLKSSLGDVYAAEKETMCACTPLTHEDVRRLIVSRGLKSMPAVMQECGWKTSCGCSSCRPALNFYLLAAWPLEYQDDPQSRFVNERNHANIQKDGTYSVVPRMWGGITTPAELRAIADAAETYGVSMVKVTGGQRIDLLGVEKADLPRIWADLNAAGLVSGHAYSKGLRTVKTCVGSEFCRFGTQDSTGLGIKLEKLLWGSWTPHKVKLAVSGCPRNCAEATCKDIGIICVDSGYEIGVAGAAGMELKETEPLAKVATEAEALEIAAAFVQLYRENARYLYRPYKWVGKVGLDWVRTKVVEDTASRKALAERFEISQSVYRKDPWAEHTAEETRERWDVMTDLTQETEA
ncbi:nitrite reductase large subunit NirB [Mangrovicoccus sp. HB161399]|uniref:nitrite reductase large subunit NirB n=1 Tax=Mangrovicoccus sp. HB161399 TaxID=2720392 RepID=UPI0015569EBD|nr:nitrite reductase large subunit NirB [Mangrovicoccus sp. HB161399]